MKKNLKEEYPEVAKEWDYEKNEGKLPENTAPKSSKKAWWKCPKCGMSYYARISDRTSKSSGCPYCAGKLPIIGVNDLESQRPDLAAEWSPNNKLKPSEVTVGSDRRVLWICPIHGEYSSHIVNRVTRGDGCRQCGSLQGAKTRNAQKIAKGITLQSMFPEISLEWHPTKNGNMKPSDFVPSSHEKVWWKCSVCGHEWKATINTRTSKTCGCNRCRERAITSFPEQAIYYYVKRCFPDAVNRYKDNFGKSELDIYIPSQKVAIEYDGSFWHADRSSDNDKYKRCKELGIHLIRVIEQERDNIENMADKVIVRKTINNQGLQETVIEILEYLSVMTDVNINQDENTIKEKYLTTLRGQSLESVYPEIAKEWHPTKNGTLLPSSFLPGSNDKVWWKCSECGHEWQAAIYARVNAKHGCPDCWEKRRSETVRQARLKRGENDLKTMFPQLSDEWDFEKNGKMEDYSYHSNVEVSWICSTCHTKYEKSIKRRTIQKYGCPKCSAKIRALHAAETKRKKKQLLENNAE